MTFLIYIGAYLIGSIPSALIIGKLIYNIDIREHGSNNPGATNSIRVLGKRAGIAVLIVDVGKGFLAAGLPLLLHADADPLLVGLTAVIGHCFPVFAQFRGGKAIATTAGTLLVVNPFMFLIAYITFFAVIFISKYVFFGSISVGLALFIYAILVQDTKQAIIFFLYLLLLIFLHRSNILNFRSNKEPKVTDKKMKNDRISSKKK